jgi:hypothetical protein
MSIKNIERIVNEVYPVSSIELASVTSWNYTKNKKGQHCVSFTQFAPIWQFCWTDSKTECDPTVIFGDGKEELFVPPSRFSKVWQQFFMEGLSWHSLHPGSLGLFLLDLISKNQSSNAKEK